jgi:two-component system, chemotaxis family, chemotaxis protein CheY
MQKILLIDDDPLVRRTIERILQKNGYDVHLAADGLEGLRTFRTLQPDLVITDLIMPVKEGLDTIRLLRTWSPEAKIIAISGGGRVANSDLLAEAAVLGASVVIAKPFEADELLVKVSNCLA